MEDEPDNPARNNVGCRRGTQSGSCELQAACTSPSAEDCRIAVAAARVVLVGSRGIYSSVFNDSDLFQADTVYAVHSAVPWRCATPPTGSTVSYEKPAA